MAARRVERVRKYSTCGRCGRVELGTTTTRYGWLPSDVPSTSHVCDECRDPVAVERPLRQVLAELVDEASP